MTWSLRRAEHKYEYDVSGVADLPEAHNPDGSWFRPDTVLVIQSDGHVDAHISGPLLNADGKPLKRQRGVTGWNLYDLQQVEEPGHHDPIPLWLREIMAEVTQ